MPRWIFKSPCPACPPGGNNTPSTWTRVSCGHTVYIWDDCDIGCPDCSSYSHIFNHRFICSNHSIEAGKTNIRYCIYVLRCMSVIAQINDIPYKTFKKMEKAIEEEGRRRGLPVDAD